MKQYEIRAKNFQNTKILIQIKSNQKTNTQKFEHKSVQRLRVNKSHKCYILSVIFETKSELRGEGLAHAAQ